MRQIAKLLLCAAAVIWLSTFGFAELPGQGFADDALPKKRREQTREALDLLSAQVIDEWLAKQKELIAQAFAPKIAQEDPIVQQFEQQFGPQFRQLYRTELHFMRLVCQPTKQQYEKISGEGEAALKATIRTFAFNVRKPAEPSDPRTPIAEALVQSVRTTLSPEQAARYQRELDQRAAARKRAALLSLVAKVDKVLILTAEQRVKLSEILENNWNDAWNQTQLLMVGYQYFPAMPDSKIFPILRDIQEDVWRGIPKGNVRFGFNLGNVQGIEIEDEVWDDDRPVQNPERRDSNGAVTGKETTKPGEKK
jgi:hypothetical protein